MTALVWFRSDLRLHDNPALTCALEEHENLVCLYIHETGSPYTLGSASKWWLHHSLESLDQSLRKKGGFLCFEEGDPNFVLSNTIKNNKIKTIYWNRRYEPLNIQQDAEIKQSLESTGIVVKTFNSHLIFEPWTVKTQKAAPFQVFTPFWKNCMAHVKPLSLLPEPEKVHSTKINSVVLESLSLLPKNGHWTRGLSDTWIPGEKGAHERAHIFFKSTLSSYKEKRDIPSTQGTSKLSPHLHFGEISPRYLMNKAQLLQRENPGLEKSATTFLNELGWREFSYHLLSHFPSMVDQPLRQEFTHFAWEDNNAHLKAWQKGETGYPIVDAGMRELWQTGWMHNRVRMITASFLIKDLLIHWKEGAAWFWDTLTDADLANNTASWQWVAGCGADAAPYFRIFNPVLQGEKFDPGAEYVRSYVPELAALPNQYIHCPWEAPHHILQQAGITLGKTYPHPIVDHKQRRNEALRRYKRLRENSNL